MGLDISVECSCFVSNFNLKTCKNCEHEKLCKSALCEVSDKEVCKSCNIRLVCQTGGRIDRWELEDKIGHCAKCDSSISGCGGRVGSYGWFHTFRVFVEKYVEKGKWGNGCPTLMNHSDCDGDILSEECGNLLDELDKIEKVFKRKSSLIPSLADSKGDIFRSQYGDDDGTFASEESWDIGVNSKGMFFIYDKPSLLDKKSKKRNTKVYYAKKKAVYDKKRKGWLLDDKVFINCPLTLEKDEVYFTGENCYECFKEMIDLFRECANDAYEGKGRIVFG